jgi:hypothetical protein
LDSTVLQVHALLYSSSWDTRVAAAGTLGGLADALPHHSVQGLAQSLLDACGSVDEQVQQGPCYEVHVLLPAFDLDRVLKKGQPLLASGGQVRFEALVGSVQVQPNVK